MDEVRKLHETDSVEDVASFLESANRAVTREEFRANSLHGRGKGHEQLLREIQEECVEVSIDPADGVAVRKAASVKGIIYDDAHEMMLVEVGRKNEKKNPDGTPLLDEHGKPVLGSFIPNYSGHAIEHILHTRSVTSLEILLGLWSFSETRKKGETPEGCVVRGAKEELDINVNLNNLNSNRRKRKKVWAFFTDIDVHMSKAYLGVRTYEVRTWVMVDAYLLSPTFKRHMERISHRRDNGVFIEYIWVRVPEKLKDRYLLHRTNQVMRLPVPFEIPQWFNASIGS